jgi:hypothetical protein
LILINAIGVILFLILFFVAFRVVWMPIKLAKLPWACTFSRTLYLKELFKVILVAQELFIPYLVESYFALAGYYVFLFVSLLLLV